MATGDGLLARLRLPSGLITPDDLAYLADLARRHGNGLIEITARGNLQVRGLTALSSAAFATAVESQIAIEDGLVVDTSPIACDDPSERADPLPLVEAIREGSRPLWPLLAPKLSVVVDGNGQIPLSALKADIRLLALGADLWQIQIGNAAPRELLADEAIAITLDTLKRLAALGPQARATDLASAPAASSPRTTQQTRPIGRFQRRAGNSTGIALPFAASDAEALGELARLASNVGVKSIRLAPGHALLIDDAPSDLVTAAKGLGFITHADDPRLRVSACAGSDGCRSGRIASRRLAAQLAARVDLGAHLHVSGCPKGCAHPAPAPLTLVGLDDGVGLVIDGRAGDTPQTRVGLDGIEAVLEHAHRQEGR